jgi:bacillithiol system protein YtxJ
MLQSLQDFSHFQRLIDDKQDFFVYKYNPNNCPLSDKTKPKVQEFLSQRTDVSWYIIDVIEQTELKVQIAEYIDIPHESPQILCFKSWEYTAHTSHMKIKESRLEDVYS